MTEKQELRKLRREKRALLAAVEELQAVVKLLSHDLPLSPELQQLTARLWAVESGKPTARVM